jgi:hypothetical protein
MKKQLLVLMLPFLAVSLWAQSPGTDRRENFRQREPVSVSGTLVLANGFIALKSGDTLYYTGGLERLVGFVDGLKENAQVRLEGYDFTRINTQTQAQAETKHFLRVIKLEIDGRSYEIGRIAVPEQDRGRRGFWPMNGCGPDFRRGGPGFGRSGSYGFDGPDFGRPGSGRHRSRSGKRHN